MYLVKGCRGMVCYSSSKTSNKWCSVKTWWLISKLHLTNWITVQLKRKEAYRLNLWTQQMVVRNQSICSRMPNSSTNSSFNNNKWNLLNKTNHLFSSIIMEIQWNHRWWYRLLNSKRKVWKTNRWLVQIIWKGKSW